MSIEDRALSPAANGHQAAGYALLRVTLGTNIAMHGISRLFAGPDTFAGKLAAKFSGSPLPQPLVHAFGQGLPWLEGCFGVLLLIGLRTRAALIGGSILILVLTFGSTLIQDWVPRQRSSYTPQSMQLFSSFCASMAGQSIPCFSVRDSLHLSHVS